MRSKSSQPRPLSASHCPTRATLPSRRAGVPSIRPVGRPAASRSSRVAISASTPKAAAIGAVMKSLVEVTIASRSPRSRCAATSAVAAGRIAGAITSRMKRACAAASSRRAALAQRRRGEGDVGVDVERAGACIAHRRRRCRRGRRRRRPSPRAMTNSPQAWSESIGSSVRSRSNRARPRDAIQLALLGQHLLQQRHRDRPLGRERELVEPVELRHQVLEVAREAGQQVVHDLVGQEGAAPIGLAPQRRAHLGLGQRLQREHVAPAEPGAQVLAQLRGRPAARCRRRGRPRLRAGVDEQARRRLLLGGVERLAIVEGDPVAVLRRLPGRRHGGFEPGDRGALLLRPLDDRMQQVRLAAARPAPRGRPAARRARASAGAPAPRRSGRAGSSRRCAPPPARSPAESASPSPSA